MLVRIEDETVVYEFEGERIAGPVSTRLDPKGRQRARWMEAEIWRKKDGTYILTQASHSTVWHLPDGAAHVLKPVETAAGDLPERAVYCGVLPSRDGREQCPAMELAEARRMEIPGVVITEADHHRVWACPDRDAVVRRMTVARRRADNSASAAVSAPMRELLTQAAANDPSFRDGGKPVVEM